MHIKGRHRVLSFAQVTTTTKVRTGTRQGRDEAVVVGGLESEVDDHRIGGGGITRFGSKP